MSFLGTEAVPPASASGRALDGPLWKPLVDTIVDRAVNGTYAAGETIPTETALGAEFRVSRSVVREAIKVLEEKSILRIDRGRGTVVLPPEHWRAFDAVVLEARLRHGDRRAVLQEVLILRMAIEPELAARAARNATSQQLTDLARIADDLRRYRGDVPTYLISDAAFHDAIAEASGLQLGREIIRSIAGPVSIQRQLTASIPNAAERSHDHHVAIYRAISERNADRAREAMRQHFEWAEQRLDAAFSQATLTPSVSEGTWSV